ncbi:MAG: flagellar basal body-associated FliL family protein [Pseudomonadota bacterium]
MAETSDMVAEAGEEEVAPKRSSPLKFLVPLLALLLPAAGGFYATYSGMVALPFGGGDESKSEKKMQKSADIAFLSMDEMVISLGPGAVASHLVFQAELETIPAAVDPLSKLRPRIVDVFNTYLRAVEERDLRTPGGMTKMRAQLLRRIRVVVGEIEVRDLLFTKFIMK